MPTEADLARLAAEAERLVFPAFDADVAWALGSLIRARAVAERLPVAIDVTVNGQTLFHVALAGATPDNAEWIRRKRNLVLRFRRASLALVWQAELAGRPLLERFALPAADYAAAGGAVPIVVAGAGCIGVATVSGLAQADDHRVVVEGMTALLAGATAKDTP